MRNPTDREQSVFDSLAGNKAMFHITKTILDKSIQDANAGICVVLCDSGVIDNDNIEAGCKHILEGYYGIKGTKFKLTISCYRAKGRGDRRIWFKGIKEHAVADDMMALVVTNRGIIRIVNLSWFVSDQYK